MYHCRNITGIPSYTTITYIEDLNQTHKGPLITTPISVSPYKSWFVDSVGYVLIVSLTPLLSQFFPSPSSMGCPKLCLIFNCGSLNLLLSDAGWSISNNDYTKLESTSIQNIFSNYFIDFFANSILFYLRPLSYIASDYWHARQCQVWASSHGVSSWTNRRIFASMYIGELVCNCFSLLGLCVAWVFVKSIRQCPSCLYFVK